MTKNATLDGISQDIRFATRSLRRSGGLALTVIGTLSVGIALLTTFFSLVNTAMFRPLPYVDADRIVSIHYFGPPDVVVNELRHSAKSFERLASFEETSSVMSGIGEPFQVAVCRVDTAVFPMLQQRPLLGSLLTDEEILNDAPVVLIGERLWRAHFGARLDVIGSMVKVAGSERRIVGIMPTPFTFRDAAQAWLPLVAVARDTNWRRPKHAIAKLALGADLGQAQRDIDLVERRLARVDSSDARRSRAYLSEDMVDRGRDSPGTKQLVLLVVGAAVCVLLVACTNVATLMLTRAARRRGEMAIRSSLGASRWQLMRQLIIESLMLGAASGVCGILLTVWGVKLCVGLIPSIDRIPGWVEFGVDGRVLMFAGCVSLVTVLIFGLWPALVGTKVDLRTVLQATAGQGMSGADPTRRVHLPVVIQLTLSLMLIVGVTAFARSYERIASLDHGFVADGVSRIWILRDPTRDDTTATDFSRFIRQLRDGVAASAPGTAVSVTGRLFNYTGNNHDDRVVSPDSRREVGGPLWQGATVISADYFRTMSIPILRGRVFDARDGVGGTPVAITSKELATELWGTMNPLGGRLVIGRHGPTVTIVGVVGDTRQAASVGGLMSIVALPSLYLPDRQAQVIDARLVVRSGLSQGSLRATVSRTLLSMGRQLPFEIIPLAREEQLSEYRTKLLTGIFGVFGLVALLLAMIGIYGVVAFGVERRTHEIGVRLAIGARPVDVVLTVMISGMKLTGIGLSLGLICAAAASGLLRSLLIGATGSYFAILATAGATFGGIALVACYLPARRASRVDPVIALKG